MIINILVGPLPETNTKLVSKNNFITIAFKKTLWYIMEN